MRTIITAAQTAVLLIATASTGLGQEYGSTHEIIDETFAVFTIWSRSIGQQPIEQQSEDNMSKRLSIEYMICNFDRKNGALVYNWETAGIHSTSGVGLPLGLCNGSSLPALKFGVLDGDYIEVTQAKKPVPADVIFPENTIGEKIYGIAKSVFNLFHQDKGREVFSTLNIEFSVLPNEATTQYIIDWESKDVTIAIPQKVFDKIGDAEMQRIVNEAGTTMRTLPLKEFQSNEADLSESEINDTVVAFTRTSESSQPLSFNITLSGPRYSREKMYVIENSTNRLIYSLTYMGAAYE